jgi:uncharacterized phage infection (PIP) family protein YhgE
MLLTLENQRQAEFEQNRANIKQRLATVRRNITNIADTLAEAGKSRALLAKLAELETYEAELLSELSQLDTQSKETLPHLTTEQLVEISNRLSANLDRRILRGLFKRILVERDDQTVYLQFEYFYPPEAPSPLESILTANKPPHTLGVS